jgi:hypothetical protein
MRQSGVSVAHRTERPRVPVQDLPRRSATARAGARDTQPRNGAGEAGSRNGAPDAGPRNGARNPAAAATGGIPGRRTITIQGRGAERYTPRRRPDRSLQERSRLRPDRAAMWAVFLGVLLVLAAATSSRAAAPAAPAPPAPAISVTAPLAH